MKLPVPSNDAFRTPHYDEFCDAAASYFQGIDPGEVARQVGPEDMAAAKWHPSEFLVLPVLPADTREAGQLRIHIWPEGIDRSDTDVHAHPWDLGAMVLTGTYVEYLPTVTAVPDEQDASWMSYTSQHQRGNVDRINLGAIGKVSMELGDPHAYGEGEVHLLPAGIFHQTPVSGNQPLVTLALMGATQHAARYLRPIQEAVPPVEPPRRLVSGADMQRALSIIRSVEK